MLIKERFYNNRYKYNISTGFTQKSKIYVKVLNISLTFGYIVAKEPHMQHKCAFRCEPDYQENTYIWWRNNYSLKPYVFLLICIVGPKGRTNELTEKGALLSTFRMTNDKASLVNPSMTLASHYVCLNNSKLSINWLCVVCLTLWIGILAVMHIRFWAVNTLLSLRKWWYREACG